MILKAKIPEIQIWVDASCCLGTTFEDHNKALYAMKVCNIEVTGG